MRLKSSIKHKLELHLRIEELNNIPQVEGKSFCKLSVVNHKNNTKFQDYSKHVDINNNRAHLNYELIKVFKIYQDSKTLEMMSLDLNLEFFSVLDHHKTKLGSLSISLIDFLKYREYQTLRFLLQDSKINSILKLSAYWSQDTTNAPPTSSAASTRSMDFPQQPFINTAQIDNEPDPIDKPQLRKQSSLGLGNVVISDDRIIDIIDKSYQIPWNDEYEDFTPQECIDDIFDRNGTGFRRNEEGVLLVDIYATQRLKQDLVQILRVEQDDGSSSSSDDEFSPRFDDDIQTGIDWSLSTFRNNQKKSSRMEINENDVRPDLASWVIN